MDQGSYREKQGHRGGEGDQEGGGQAGGGEGQGQGGERDAEERREGAAVSRWSRGSGEIKCKK